VSSTFSAAASRSAHAAASPFAIGRASIPSPQLSVPIPAPYDATRGPAPGFPPDLGLYSARSLADRLQAVEDLRALFSSSPVDDHAYERAWEVQEALTARGQHRSAGAVDLIVAATAELLGLTLLHRDHDFDTVAAITGQAVQWYGSPSGT
jgi:hypothetical protein